MVYIDGALEATNFLASKVAACSYCETEKNRSGRIVL